MQLIRGDAVTLGELHLEVVCDGLLGRLKGAFKPPEPPSPPEPEAAPPGDETNSRNLLQRLGDGDGAAKARWVTASSGRRWRGCSPPGASGPASICSAASRGAARGLRARRAPDRAPVRSPRGRRGAPAARTAARVAEHALRARFLLGELAERSGDEESARRHLEAVLAVDLDYPKARAKVDLLKRTGAGTATTAPTSRGADARRPARRRRARSPAAIGSKRELGRGGSGPSTWRHDEELGRDVALKILHPHARAAGARRGAGAGPGSRRAAAGIPPPRCRRH